MIYFGGEAVKETLPRLYHNAVGISWRHEMHHILPRRVTVHYYNVRNNSFGGLITSTWLNRSISSKGIEPTLQVCLFATHWRTAPSRGSRRSWGRDESFRHRYTVRLRRFA